MNDELDLRALLGPVKRQAKLIVTIVLFVLAIAAVIGFSLTPKYQATTLVYVDTGQTSLLDDEVQFSNSSTDNTKVTSEVEIVKSDGVILNLIDKMNLVNDNEFGVKLSRSQKLLTLVGLSENTLPSGANALSTVIGKVKSSINVQRKGLTYIISISATSSDAEKAALLANELSKSYIELQLSSKIDNVQVSRAVVEKQIQEIEGSVLTTQQNLNDFISDNLERIASVNRGTNLERIQDSIVDLRQQKLLADSQKSWILKGLGGGVWLSDFSGLKTDALRELEAQRAQITGQISASTRDSLSLTELQSRLDDVQKAIEREAEDILSGVNQNISTIETSISEFQSELNNEILGGGIQLPDDIGAQLYRLSQQTKNTNTQYQTLLAKAQELEAESLLQIADSRIISPAIAPNSPVSPNLKLILAAAGVMSLGLGLAVAFVLENYIGGFTSSEQVEAITGVQVASSVRKLTGTNKAVSEHIVTQPLSIFAENIRRIRTSMQIALQNKLSSGKKSKGTVVMVSSAVPGEGKSSTSLSLARMLAFSGSRTIIIDCDVRKPSIASYMDIETGKGLANLFSGEITPQTFAENVEFDHLTNLHAILGYRNELQDVQFMLGFQNFKAIIEEAKQHYDYIILDTPPIGPVADALTLTAYSDIILFVIKWATTSQRAVLESLKLVKGMSPDLPALTVLNRVEGDVDGSYTQYSGYYTDA